MFDVHQLADNPSIQPSTFQGPFHRQVRVRSLNDRIDQFLVPVEFFAVFDVMLYGFQMLEEVVLLLLGQQGRIIRVKRDESP
jgi:hypothetical protein